MGCLLQINIHSNPFYFNIVFLICHISQFKIFDYLDTKRSCNWKFSCWILSQLGFESVTLKNKGISVVYFDHDLGATLPNTSRYQWKLMKTLEFLWNFKEKWKKLIFLKKHTKYWNTEHFYHAFVYSPVSLLSSIYRRFSCRCRVDLS